MNELMCSVLTESYRWSDTQQVRQIQNISFVAVHMRRRVWLPWTVGKLSLHSIITVFVVSNSQLSVSASDRLIHHCLSLLPAVSYSLDESYRSSTLPVPAVYLLPNTWSANVLSSSCSGLLYALRILRTHGMSATSLYDVFELQSLPS